MPQEVWTAAARPSGADGNAPDLTEEAIASLQGHPGFEAAMLAAATAIIDLYRDNWVLNRLVNDRGRFILGLMIISLHFAADHDEGFTPAQLQETAGAAGVCSPGRITAFLASLRLLGLLRPVPTEDRRQRRLVPTERFLALHRERWRRLFEALAMIRPEGETAITALNDPVFIGGFARALVAAHCSGLRMAQFVPEVRSAVERDAGFTVLLSLLLAEVTEQSASIAVLARRFSVSRAHVLMVLREAERWGLAAPVGPRGGYRAGPGLGAVMRRFFAIMFLMHLHGIHIGRRRNRPDG